MKFVFLVFLALILIVAFAKITEVIEANKAERNKDLPEPAGGSLKKLPALSEEVRVQVEQLVQEGNTVEAIKLVREHTGLGLAEAKALVESFDTTIN